MMENCNPLVSVLMTSYNREKYLANAIESVLASTYENFELLIVDDGSKDRTVDIARDYAQKDNRVKVFINEKNLGDYPNRNCAASHAKGKYLKYVDADDYIYPRGLQILVDMMEQFPDAGYGLCSLAQDDIRPFPFCLSPAEAYRYNYLGPGLFHKAPLSSIIRKSVFDEVDGFRPIRMAGDFEMWHRLSQKYKVVLMPHGIVWYRKHNEQEINSYRQFIGVYEQIKVTYLTDEACPLGREEAQRILNDNKKNVYKQLVKGIAKAHGVQITDSMVRLRQYKKGDDK